MTEEEELAHLHAPSADPKQRQIDYWGRRAERAEGRLERAKEIIAQQAADEGCWFLPQTCAEDYLQRQLRELHAAIEGTDIYGRKPT